MITQQDIDDFAADAIEQAVSRETLQMMPDFTGAGETVVLVFAEAGIRYEGIPAISEMLASGKGGFLAPEYDDDNCLACNDTGEGQAPDSVCPACSNPRSRMYRGEPCAN